MFLDFHVIAGQATEARLEYFRVQAELMTSLMELNPDMKELLSYGHKVMEAREAAAENYNTMLTYGRGSVKVSEGQLTCVTGDDLFSSVALFAV